MKTDQFNYHRFTQLTSKIIRWLFAMLSLSMIGWSSVTPEQINIRREVLSSHNKLRAKHNAPNLVWDEALSDYAERHAKKCFFQHSASPYGENLAAGYPSISAAVQAWYAERDQYSYDKPGFSNSTGHFTQVVWKASRHIGCAYAICNGKNGTPGQFWVCEYSPAGNVTNKGYFEKNVLARFDQQ